MRGRASCSCAQRSGRWAVHRKWLVSAFIASSALSPSHFLGVPRRAELGYSTYVTGTVSLRIAGRERLLTDRLLMPAFGTSAIRDMFPEMLDLATQLALKWERYGCDLCCICIARADIEACMHRFGPQHKIDPAEDFTRLTLDTIALCSMSHRYAS